MRLKNMVMGPEGSETKNVLAKATSNLHETEIRSIASRLLQTRLTVNMESEESPILEAAT
jgi:hypothetical protein